MNSFLAVCVFIAVGVSICEGQCRMMLPSSAAPGATPPVGCNWNGYYFGYMKHVTKNCETCYCNEGGALSCCVNGVHVVHVPDDCKIVPAEDGCGDRAVKLDNENEDCDHDIAAVSRRDLM